MLICCLGDSLTEGDYGVAPGVPVPNVQEKNYPYFLQKIVGGEVKNYGKCGFNASSYLEYYQAGNVDVAGADYILIMLGTNGGMTLQEETQGNADYKKLIALCRKDAENAQIILCTPPHATVNPECFFYGYAPHVAEAVAFVKECAKEEKLSVIDVAACPDFTDETEKEMQPNDGLHFGEKGYQTLAAFIAEKLNRIIKLNQARAFFKGDRFATENGMVIDELTEDGCVCSVVLNDHHKNALGGVMGGVIFTLADFALAVSGNDSEHSAVAMNASVNFLNSVKGTKLIATSRCVKDGRSSAVYNVDILDDTDRVIAQFSGTCFKLR